VDSVNGKLRSALLETQLEQSSQPRRTSLPSISSFTSQEGLATAKYQNIWPCIGAKTSSAGSRADTLGALRLPPISGHAVPLDEGRTVPISAPKSGSTFLAAEVTRPVPPNQE